MRVAFITFVAVCTILAIGGGKKQGIFADAQGKSDRYNTSLPNVKKVKKNYSFLFIKNERKVKLIPTFLPQSLLSSCSQPPTSNVNEFYIQFVASN